MLTPREIEAFVHEFENRMCARIPEPARTWVVGQLIPDLIAAVKAAQPAEGRRHVG